MTHGVHPAQNDFLAATKRLDHRFSRPNIATHLLNTRMEYVDTAGVLTPSLALILNPFDGVRREHMYDPSVMAQAVYFGQAAGTLLTFEAYGITKAVASSMYRQPHELSIAVAADYESRPLDEEQHAVAIGLIRKGDDGLAIAGYGSTEWLEEIEDMIVSEVPVRPFFRTAAGIAISIYRETIEQMWERNHLEQLKELHGLAASGALDWDTWASGLAEDERLS